MLAAYALISIGLASETTRLKWKNLSAPWSQVLERSFTTFLDVERLLAPPGTPAVSWRPGAPRPPRVLSIGEWRTYKFPCRLLYRGQFGETPVVGKMVKESRNLEELSKKFRQLGVQRLLYNYVTVDWMTPIHNQFFPWDRQHLRLYVDFCKQYLVISGRTQRSDYLNGGFYVYEVRRRPLMPPPPTIWFTPGAESVYGPGVEFDTQGRLKDALRAYLAAFALLPDVGEAWNRVGHVYALLGDLPNALRYLRKFGEAGMLDSVNLGELGAAAVRMGELDLAERVLAEALVCYPDRRHIVLINQAIWNGQKAFRELRERQLDAAEKYVEQGLAVMADKDLGLAEEQAWRAALGFLFGMKGEVYLARGERNLAAKWFAEATRLKPKVSWASRWKELAAEL